MKWNQSYLKGGAFEVPEITGQNATRVFVESVGEQFEPMQATTILDSTFTGLSGKIPELYNISQSFLQVDQ